jgi:prepilin-type N-terminal cleavage/methylation domain-containing protein
MKNRLKISNNQRGFTLIEMVIAIGILAMMAAIAVFSYNGDKSRAGLLVGLLDGYASAEKMLKSGTSCYSKTLSALNNPGDADGIANNWCGATLSKQWQGPYATPFETDANLNIKASALSPDMVVTTARISSTFGGSSSAIPSWKWYIVATNIPDGIFAEAMTTCNGASDANGITAGSATNSNRKCLDDTASGLGAIYGTTLPGLTAGAKTMLYLFDETRK